MRETAATTLRSLHVRNYRLYFTGQVISIAGTWTQNIGQALLVLDLSHDSGVAAGTVVAMQFLPTLFFGAMAGVVIDRFDKRKLLMTSQAILGVNALVLAVLVLSGVAELWMVYAMAFANGLVTSLDLPLRNAFVSEMVTEDDLANAVALNSATFNVARIVGPAIAALILLVANDNKGICFIVNSISYLAVIGCIAMQDTEQLIPSQPAPRAKGQVREGVRYTWAIPQVRYTVALVGVFGTLALNSQVVLPLIAKVDFHRESTYTAMTVAMGVGSLIGALAAASRGRPSVRLLVGACLGFGVSSILAAAAPTLLLMLPMLAVMGLCTIAFLSTANALVQLSVSPMMRGRVLALYSMVLLGGTPLGSTLAGWIADAYSPRVSLVVAATGTLIGCLLLGPGIRKVRDDHSAMALDETVLHEPSVA
jgi:MFS family permease